MIRVPDRCSITRYSNSSSPRIVLALRPRIVLALRVLILTGFQSHVCRRTRYLFALPRRTGCRRPAKTTPEPDVNCEIVSRSDSTSTLPPSLIIRLRSQNSSICCMHLSSISSLIICLFAIFTDNTGARTIINQNLVVFARAMLEIIGLDQH
jgi:hypothetical protein